MARRVLAISVAPLFPGAVDGGSQRILEAVVLALAEAGASVRVACSWRPENDGGFDLAPGVRVDPLLQLKGRFPEPWEAPPHRIAATARALRPALAEADAVYLHADTFYLRGLLNPDVPVVRSFHDFHYENTLISAYAFSAAETIVPSEYLRRCILAGVGEAGARRLEPVRVIPNGIDLQTYRPGNGAPPAGVSPRRDGDLVLLHPHRPDERKGIREALAVVAGLGRTIGPGRRVRLLVPRHIDAETSPATRAYYERVERDAAEADVPAALELVPWLDGARMAALYSFGDVTLCLGNFIESFGLTAFESLACGTPVVAARVGALRDLPAHPDVHRVDHGDIAAAVEAVGAAAEGMRDVAGIRAVLGADYSFEGMKSAYADAILNPGEASSAPGVDMSAGERGADELRLAPWCHVSGARVYNDYAYGFAAYPALAPYLAAAGGGAVTEESARAAGVPPAEWAAGLREGVLTAAR